MKTVKNLLLLSLVFLGLVACKQKTETSQADNSVSGEAQEQSEAGAELAQETDTQEATSFEKTLSLQGITFHIKTTGEGSIRNLTIEPEGLSMGSKVEMETDGAVVNAEIEDLNSDGSPEVLIYTTSAGSGGYGNVIGYSVNAGKSMSEIYFPEIAPDSDAAKGYMGHDEFTIIETTLVRRFPVYKEGDSNAEPTGNIRQIQYKMVDGEASRKFVIDQVIEIPKD